MLWPRPLPRPITLHVADLTMSAPLTLSDLSQRLFTKPPSLQNVKGEQVTRYLNAPVCDVGEELVTQLLQVEHCTTAKDQKEFNEYVTTGTLLHLLAFVGRHEAMKWLLDSGAYPHTLNHTGSTPLHVAAVRHQPEVIKALRLHHADAYTENKDGKTAIDVGSDADDVKEALLAYRFSGEEAEDEFLQERIPALVERVTDSSRSDDEQLHSLLSMRAEMRMATSSMTSVPKPLKLLRDYYASLEEVYEKMATCPSQAVLADILSMQAMAMEDKERKILKYRMKGSQEKINSFGHPYIRRLCAEIPDQWREENRPEHTLKPLVRKLAVFCLEHSAESEACDMLMEISRIDLLLELVTEDVHERVCLYLISCVKYVPEPEDNTLLHIAMRLYRQFKRYPQALRLAMMLNELDLIRMIFLECPTDIVRKQLAFMLGRQQVFLSLEDKDCSNSEDLSDIMSNVHLNTNFLALGRELDIMEPKVPEDIYKTHLEHSRFSTANTVDSSRANLAASFVNGFVNTAFGEDKLMVDPKWIHKHKGSGMFSATASLGLILLWDVEGGLTQIDKLLYSSEDYIKAGALMACGIVNVGVRNDIDPALALCVDYVVHASSTMRLGAIMGLGLAYAGSCREDVVDIIAQVLWDASTTFEVVCLGALSCAMIFVGTCHGETSENILQLMMERDPGDLVKTPARFLALALALLYLGKQDAVDATVEALKVLPEPFCTFASTLLEICAYAGTGDVLKIQELLHTCSEFHGNKEEEEGAESDSTSKEGGDGKAATGKESGGDGGKDATAKKADTSKQEKAKDVEMKDGETPEPGSLSEPGAHQAVSVLGIALIAMGEDIGAEMALRIFNHLLHYGDPVIRRAVPLALSLLSTSNPQLPILDTLGKFSHDSDPSVARNAIFAMGLVGSGTNNARLAGMLRNLAQFYHKEPLDLFMVRLAQGLTHLGKGTLTLNPFHSDRMLMTPVAVAGIMAVLVSMLDASNIILRDSHYMLYFLTPAIQPRMLVTFDEDLSPLPVTVRVGQAVDVVGQAGKPKTITGFQTHTTPVLLAYGERAELATEEYIALTPIVEGFVILKKNPDYTE